MCLQVSARRQLTKDMEADLTWALGPHPMHALSLDVSKRGKHSRLSGVVEVGNSFQALTSKMNSKPIAAEACC